ncbi:uncharacterized protein M437DRAFT_86132 [Aureobasidium melanogenum CBS 110374]|uniref:Uncharacterized protein n=1 Tax=Aureobasidium melanogenum (strain CBS 110374) TaxID=1043003 RepID=A0A074WFH7_AURM1|nr:uncharacterized protein M437DRAFT_86132 [Aureobasidium melanogenum CBS 110374]KEQ61241.1 hypothetical protein M437DRAFT_86132 [Aureobasidium melanogenum CBS 110374]
MSSPIAQLVLDLIVFAVIHYFIIFPLIKLVLGYVKGESDILYAGREILKAFEKLKAFVGEQSVQKPSNISAPAPFTTQLPTADEALCERCEILLEDKPHVTRRSCDCTWCAECVEECFEIVKFDLDKPLSSLSKGCKPAQKLTIRKMLPYVKHLLSEKSSWQIEKAILVQDTIIGIAMSKNDWMLDVDE